MRLREGERKGGREREGGGKGRKRERERGSARDGEEG